MAVNHASILMNLLFFVKKNMRFLHIFYAGMLQYVKNLPAFAACVILNERDVKITIICEKDENTVDVASLNKKRNSLRYAPLVMAAVEIVAVILIVLGLKLPGAVLGTAALVGGIVYKNRGKKDYANTCCRLQAMNALGLKDAEYLGNSKEEETWLGNMHLLPSSARVTKPLVMHAVRGDMHGIPMWIAEVTMGCMENGKRQPTFSSGVMIRCTLENAAFSRALFLGRYAFKHAALRNEYEKDALRLAPAGGKEKGWYAMTENGRNPDALLVEKWQSLCDAAGMRAAMYVEGKEVKAFFNGNFYTGEFELEEEVTAAALKHHSFAALVPFVEMLEALRGETEEK